MSDVLIGVDDLVEAMLSNRPPVVLDVRWRLGDDSGAEHYRAGHIPGAVFVDLDAELAAPASAEAGRHPLPALADLQEAARRWGIDDDVPVVVYDDWDSLAAARAWWLLRWAGIGQVQILDGALDAWREAGLRLSTGDAVPRVGAVTLTGGALPTVTIDEVAALSHPEPRRRVLDARAGERYRGELEPVDPRPGHIPGAISAPTVENLVAGGRFASPDVLRARFDALGAGDGAVVYCGSGVTAAHQIAAMTIAGISDVALYPGSYSQWSSDPERAVELG